jgi:hypothetical protein
MVSLKWLFLTAAATVSVLAQDPPTGDAAEAAAYWEQAESAQLTGGDSPEKRDVVNVKAPRNDPVVLKDPYKGSYCWAPYTAPPCATTCNRNNCYRGFLNARDGSSGKHCPKEAFGFCCAWNFGSDFQKYWYVATGGVYHFAPYAASCKNDGDSTWDVVKKINDVCGCTLNHEATVDVTSAYYGLRRKSPHSPECH